MAAIDIGSNSLRLVIAQLHSGGQFQILDEARETTRLASRLASTGRLDPDAIVRTLQGLARFQEILSPLPVTHLRAFATCAVRESENGLPFCERVLAELGLKVEVISGEQEARYAFASVQHAHDVSQQNVAVADVGGGSTEIVLSARGQIEGIYCAPLGAVRLSENCGQPPLRCGANYDELVNRIDGCLNKTIPHPPLVPDTLYGTGGTFRSLAMMLASASQEDPNRWWGAAISRVEVRDWLDHLRQMSDPQRKNVPGLIADRSDIIVAGLAIVERVMRRLGVNTLRVHPGGVREGLLRTMAGQIEIGE